MVANMEYDELYKAILRPGREMETWIERERKKYHKSLLCFDVHAKDGSSVGHCQDEKAQDAEKRLLSQQSGLKSLSQRAS